MRNFIKDVNNNSSNIYNNNSAVVTSVCFNRRLFHILDKRPSQLQMSLRH